MKKINIDGIDYNIDIDKAIKDGYLVKHVNRRVGQFYINRGHSPHILSQVDASKVSLICLRDGNRHTESVTVANIFNISDDEWSKITSGRGFSLVQGSYKVE